jgi:orotidine-5'-phosphate decarboxylase
VAGDEGIEATAVWPEEWDTMIGFADRLEHAWETSGSMLCVGLDPDPAKLPGDMRGDASRIGEFCRAIVDATADQVCAFKPQIAYFAAAGAEEQLVEVCRYIREAYPNVVVILDAKRGDIGSTAEQYAVEAFERYNAHAVTVNPYLGVDSIEPFLRYTDRGVIVLCRTSNPGGDDLQGLVIEGEPLFTRVATMVRDRCNDNRQCALVVGATYPAEMGVLRDLCPDIPFLVPGVGAQGGDPAEIMGVGRTASGRGLIVNSSRAVLYASSDSDYVDAARRVAMETAAVLRA